MLTLSLKYSVILNGVTLNINFVGIISELN